LTLKYLTNQTEAALFSLSQWEQSSADKKCEKENEARKSAKLTIHHHTVWDTSTLRSYSVGAPTL
jgi:hypothetical protein